MYILDLIAVDRSTEKVGGKASGLGEILRSGLPVSPGFVLTTDAFEIFIKENRLKEKIDFTLSSIDLNNLNDLKEKSKYLENLIISSQIPDSVVKDMSSAYDRMSYGSEIKIMNERALDIIKTGRDRVFVSVRTSVNGFYGQTKTFLNVSGSEKLLEGIKRCWASVFSPRAIFYSKSKSIAIALPAVLIQKMVNSEKSGVLYTSNPVMNEQSKIIIECSWGLGQGISSGIVSPDFYVIEKSTGKILEKKIAKKYIQLRRDQIGNTLRDKVPDDKVNMQTLNEFEIKKLWEFAIRVESLFGCPQEMEWCEERGRIFLTQTREIKTTSNYEEPEGKLLSQGIGASSGISKGKLKLIINPEDLSKIEKGDVVFTKNFPETVLHFGKISGLICEDVGISSDLPVSAREFGIPCVVCFGKTLKENEDISINGSSGKIFSVENHPIFKEPPGSDTGKIITATEILSQTTDSDGCVFRVEQSFSDHGKHPIHFANADPEGFIQMLTNFLGQIAKSFYPKPVWYRSLDVKTNEFQNLETDDPKEDNPLLGFRGSRRSLDEDILKYELEALKRLQSQGLNNICLLLPFVTNVDELKFAKQLIDFSVKIGICCDTPSCALTIEDFCKEKVDFVLIEVSDLSQLVLGVDKENPNVSKFYCESHPSVLKLVKEVIQTCKKNGIKIGIHGADQKLLETVIEGGIDCISSEEGVKASVARIERKILLQKSRERLF